MQRRERLSAAAPVALVSPAIREECQARGVALEAIALPTNGRLDAATLERIDIAFMSMDFAAGSGQSPEPDREEFFAHLLSAKNLRWLHVYSAGADRPIFSELRARGVRLTTSSGANATEVSHSVLAGVLALARGVPQWIRNQQQHVWWPMKGSPAPKSLVGQRGVVVGMGPIGRAIARHLQALGLSIVGVSRSGDAVPECARVIPWTQLDEILPRADWLVLACPLTPLTRGLIHQGRLALLPAGAHVVNAARGPVLVESDLVDAVRSGHLGGAYLDVFETEPLPSDSPLWDLPGTLLSAHRAGYSSGVHARTMDIFIENLRRWRDGGILLNEVGGQGAPDGG